VPAIVLEGKAAVKKLMNAADDYVDEMLDGLCSMHPALVRTGSNGRVVTRAAGAVKGKVGIVSGGGSGHLPLFTGYVGEGLLDACAIGDIFAGPSVESCMDAIRTADGGRGVLRLFGNYGGDRMNFNLAGELLEGEGIELTTVLGRDDIASGAENEREKRRGVAGIIYAYKVAGAKAAQGADLQEVTRVAEAAVDRCRTIGCAWGACQIPGAAGPTFTIGDDEVEMGIGIHGEPGIWRDRLKPADALTGEMVARLLEDSSVKNGGRASVLVNSLGATSLEELFIAYRSIASLLKERGIEIVSPLVGHYATSMEMAGFSVSILAVDEELESLLAAPADCPFWKV